MFKRNLIALSRMLGIPGLVVMTEQGAVARKITSSTLTITNPDGVDGDINIEGGGGGGGASVVDSIADGDTTNAPSRNAVYDALLLKADAASTTAALAGKSAVGHTHTSSEVTDFAEAVRDRVGSTLVAGTNITITPDDAGDTITIEATDNAVPGTLQYVGSYTVSGAATNTISVPYDGDLSDVEKYVIEVKTSNPTASNGSLSLNVNGVTTATAYYVEQSTMAGGTVNSGIGRNNDAVIASMELGQAFSSTIEIWMAKDDKPRAAFRNVRAAPNVINLQWGDWVYNTAGLVNSITLNSSVAGSFAVGSVVTVYKVVRGSGVVSGFAPFNRRTQLYKHYNMLNGANVVTGTTFESNALPTIYRTISAGTTAVTTSADGAYVTIGSGTNALTAIRFFATSVGATLNPQSGELRASTRIRIPTLSDATQSFNIDCGFTNAITGATRSLILSYTHSVNGGMWVFKGTDSAGTTSVNTTVPVVAGQIYNIDIIVESSTSAKAYVDDVLVATLTTNVPYVDNLGVANMLTKQVGTTTRTLDTWYFEIQQDVTR